MINWTVNIIKSQKPKQLDNNGVIIFFRLYLDGFAQDCGKFIISGSELPQCSNKPLILS